MVLVAALMVHPGLRIAFFIPFRGIGAAVTLKIPGTHQKFRGCKLGKIMGQALPVKPHPKAPLPHQPAVVGDGTKMFPGFQRITPS
jgi:hypothetical protein